MLWSGYRDGGGDFHGPVVLAGSVIGMSLPFLLSRYGLDPATASAPLITSIADAIGVVIYLSMALAILGMPQIRA